MWRTGWKEQTADGNQVAGPGSDSEDGEKQRMGLKGLLNRQNLKDKHSDQDVRNEKQEKLSAITQVSRF